MPVSSGAVSRPVFAPLVPVAVAVLAGGLVLAGCLPEQTPTPEATQLDPTPAAVKTRTTAPSTPSETPTTLPALEQPGEWEDPQLLEHPGEDATIFKRLEYEMVNQIWVAAGVRAATEVNCNVDWAEVLIPGDYDYECVATYDGVDVPYSVTTTTDETTSTSVHNTKFLPITKEKAEHELTRQALEPAKISCEMDDVQLVAIDDPEALLCEVTNVDDQTRLYYGEVSANGGVFFDPAS